MLILTRRKDQRIIIDERIEVAIVDIKGDQVKLGIDAPKDVSVFRSEVFQAIQEENRIAAYAPIELPSLDILGDRNKDASKKQH